MTTETKLRVQKYVSTDVRKIAYHCEHVSPKYSYVFYSIIQLLDYLANYVRPKVKISRCYSCKK